MQHDEHTDFLFKNLARNWTDGLDHQNKCTDRHGPKYEILGPSLLVTMATSKKQRRVCFQIETAGALA